MKPTYEQIVTAIAEKNLDVDPEKFFTYYEQRDWRMGNGAYVLDFRVRLMAWHNRTQMGGPRTDTVSPCGGDYHDRWHAEAEAQLARRAQYAKDRIR